MEILAKHLEMLPLEVEKVDDDLQVFSAPPPRKKARKYVKSQTAKVEEDDNKMRNWLDSEVKALIALKGEMQPEFNSNAKKQGVDMWLKLHSKLLLLHPNFKKTPKACKSKFSDVQKAYKEAKQFNNISGEAQHTCKFYDSMDRWYHKSGSILKHVSASSSDIYNAKGSAAEGGTVDSGTTKGGATEGGAIEPGAVKTEDFEPNLSSARKQKKVTAKLQYQEQALGLISQVVESSRDMAGSMKAVTGFMGNLDKHIEKIIEKL